MLASPRKQSEPNDEEAAKIDAGLIDELSDLFTMHHMPIVVLGSGRTTLRDKWAAIMHAFFWRPAALSYACDILLTASRR